MHQALKTCNKKYNSSEERKWERRSCGWQVICKLIRWAMIRRCDNDSGGGDQALPTTLLDSASDLVRYTDSDMITEMDNRDGFSRNVMWLSRN